MRYYPYHQIGKNFKSDNTHNCVIRDEGWDSHILLWSYEFLKSNLANYKCKKHTYHILHDSASGKLAHKIKSTSMQDSVYKNVIASLLWCGERRIWELNECPVIGEWMKKNCGTPISWICIYIKKISEIYGRISISFYNGQRDWSIMQKFMFEVLSGKITLFWVTMPGILYKHLNSLIPGITRQSPV